jgi:hypothetical protein
VPLARRAGNGPIAVTGKLYLIAGMAMGKVSLLLVTLIDV